MCKRLWRIRFQLPGCRGAGGGACWGGRGRRGGAPRPLHCLSAPWNDQSSHARKGGHMSSHVPAASSGGRIALAGATGRIGSALAASLVADPVSVVALDQPGSLESALQGAQRLFIAHGTSPRQVRNEIALIDAAVKVGVAHVVKVSSMGPPSTLPPFAWHIAIEAHLAKQPLGYTVLRPSAFVDILHRAGSQVAAGTWGGAAGEGLVTFIDTCDVAEVARAALLAALEPGTQRVHHLTGSRSWSMPQIAEELSRLLGRQILYEHRTPAAQREL